MSKSVTTSNPEYIKAMRDIRKSNAAGTHADKRTRRKRSREAAKAASISQDLKNSNP